jgi:hypothetical protein
MATIIDLPVELFEAIIDGLAVVGLFVNEVLWPPSSSYF